MGPNPNALSCRCDGAIRYLGFFRGPFFRVSVDRWRFLGWDGFGGIVGWVTSGCVIEAPKKLVAKPYKVWWIRYDFDLPQK